MSKRSFLSKIGMLLGLVVLLLGTAPVSANAAAIATWYPTRAKAGMGSIVWTNYVGTDELTIDWGGTYYKVAPETNNIPGRMQIDVAPGTYTYTASTPFGALSRTVDIAAGHVIDLSFFAGDNPILQGKVHNLDNFLGRGKAHEDEPNPDAHMQRFDKLLVSQEDVTTSAL
jgi:hypothetical protein